DIFFVSNRFQVLGVYTRTLATQVIKLALGRDRPDFSFKNKPMRKGPSESSIPLGIYSPLPYPARGFIPPVFFNIFNGCNFPIVPRDKADRLAFDDHSVASGNVGNGNGFAATTHTQAGRVRGTLKSHFWSLLNRFRGAVPRDVPPSPGLSLCLNYTR